MKIERWDFLKGENVLFYIPEDGLFITIVGARVYTSQEGKKEFVLDKLEDGIWNLTIDFNHLGKYVAVFSEDGIKKLIVIITVKD